MIICDNTEKWQSVLPAKKERAKFEGKRRTAEFGFRAPQFDLEHQNFDSEHKMFYL